MTVHYLEIPIELLDDGSNVRAPAKRLSQSDVGLRASILELGVLQPITVVRRGKGGHFASGGLAREWTGVREPTAPPTPFEAYWHRSGRHG